MTPCAATRGLLEVAAPVTELLARMSQRDLRQPAPVPVGDACWRDGADGQARPPSFVEDPRLSGARILASASAAGGGGRPHPFSAAGGGAELPGPGRIRACGCRHPSGRSTSSQPLRRHCRRAGRPYGHLSPCCTRAGSRPRPHRQFAEVPEFLLHVRPVLVSHRFFRRAHPAPICRNRVARRKLWASCAQVPYTGRAAKTAAEFAFGFHHHFHGYPRRME